MFGSMETPMIQTHQHIWLIDHSESRPIMYDKVPVCVEIASEIPVGGIIKHTWLSVGPKAIVCEIDVVHGMLNRLRSITAESRVVAQEQTTSTLS